MKKSAITLLVAALATIAIVSCKEKKTSEHIITTKPVEEAKKPTQEIGNYDMTTPVDWVGSTYQVVVERKADHSLPLADDGQGNKYFDNRISLKILRKDGSVFFSRVFTKNDFSRYVAGYRPRQSRNRPLNICCQRGFTRQDERRICSAGHEDLPIWRC